ncbi:hypothetical protein RJ639_025593, partial [Escallonia herrerae]
KARKFETGLNPDIQEAIAPLNISDYHEIVDRALNIERTLGFTRAKRAQMSLSRPPVPQWQAGRFPSTSGGGKFFRTDMRSIAYTPRPQTQGFMPRPFITGQRPQPRPGVRPTQYMPPQQQPVQAVSRYCTFCGMTGHTEEVCRKRKGTCFACGAQGHQMRDCPKKKGFVATTGDISGTGIGTGRRVNKPTIKARAFALGQDEVQGSPAVVGGTVLISGTLARVNSNGEPRREFDSLSLRLYSSRNGANGLLTKSLPGYNGSTSGNRSTPNLQTRRTKTMAQNSFGHRNETAEILQKIISG